MSAKTTEARQGEEHGMLGERLGRHTLATGPHVVVVHDLDHIVDSGAQEMDPPGVWGGGDAIGQRTGIPGIEPHECVGVGERHDFSAASQNCVGHPDRGGLRHDSYPNG
jgi:hypothetical protein